MVDEILEEEIIEETKEEEAEMAEKKEIKLGKLVSRLNHPVYISYNGYAMMIAPRAKALGINKELLGALPKGVKYVE